MRPLTVILAVMVVAACAAILATAAAVRPQTYTAVTDVLYQPQNNALAGSVASGSDIERALATQANVVTGDAVMDLASAQLGVSSDDLLDATDVSVDPDSNVLAVTVDASSAREATRRSRAVAQQYVAFSRSEARQGLQSQADALGGAADAIRSQISGTAGSSSALSSTLSDLLQQQSQLAAAAQIEPGPASVLAEAKSPRGPSSVAPMTAAILGAAIGVVLALGLLLIIGWWRRPLEAIA